MYDGISCQNFWTKNVRAGREPTRLKSPFKIQDIDELRQLVQARLPQEAPEACLGVEL
jgi:hypothetical protein